MGEELKPCPFCGGKAVLRKSYDGDGFATYFSYACKACGASSGEQYATETCGIFFESLLASWNTRSDLAVEVKPLTFEDASGVAMLGRYVAFDAETPIGRVSYGTDAEGEHWYAYPGMARNALHTSAASLEDARSKAVAGYEKSLLSHPVASAWNTRPDDLRSKLQALVAKWEGMTCRTKCAEELREVLEGIE